MTEQEGNTSVSLSPAVRNDASYNKLSVHYLLLGVDESLEDKRCAELQRKETFTVKKITELQKKYIKALRQNFQDLFSFLQLAWPSG